MSICRNNNLKDSSGNDISGSSAAPLTSEVIDLAGLKGLAFQIQATTIGTVIFQASNDQVDWIDIDSLSGTLPFGINVKDELNFRYGRLSIDTGTNIKIIVCIEVK